MSGASAVVWDGLAPGCGRDDRRRVPTWIQERVNLTIEEVIYWAALASWYTHNAPATQTVIRAYNERDHSLLARLERVHWREARSCRRLAYEDWAREHIFAAMLLRQAWRLVLERIAELEER